MNTIQIKNLKSITDTGPLSIKPITVFVGANSSGKSSLIRTFPLFKQSSESKILGTVLWSGKYVDYGSYVESLNLNASKNESAEISFSFTFTVNAPPTQRLPGLADGTIVKVTINVHGDEYSKSSYSEIVYEIHGNTISMRVASDLKIVAVTINKTDLTKQVSEVYRAYKIYSIVPLLFPISRSIALGES